MFLWNFNQKQTSIEPVRLQEKIKYEITVNNDGYNAKSKSTFKEAIVDDTYDEIATISLKRDLRTNNIKVFLEGTRNLRGAFFVNHDYWGFNSLRPYETRSRFYKLSPENILHGDLGHMEKLEKFGLAIDEGYDDHNSKIEINLKSHTNLSNSQVIDKGGGVEVSTLTTSNFIIVKKRDTGAYRVYRSDLYNHLLFKPKSPKARTITDLYDVYENFDVGASKTLDNYQDIPKGVIYPSFNGLNIDYHDGKFKGLYNDSKTALNASLQDGGIQEARELVVKDAKTSLYKKYEFKGKVSLNGYAYYDYDDKETKIGVGPGALKGYIFPYSKKGVMHSDLTISPNKATQNIHLYRDYNFNKIILGKYNGLVKLSIDNPSVTNGDLTYEFKFNKYQQNIISLSEMNLSEMSEL